MQKSNLLVCGLLEQIQQAIQKTLPEKKKVGVAFSGGVDSSVMAKICVDLGYDITLLTIGFENSHDIWSAKKINETLGFSHKILKIEHDTFKQISSEINHKIKTDNLSWNENCIAFYYISKLAKSIGIKVVVTANGMDELFCGYNAYREVIKEGKNKVMQMMNQKLENEIKMMEAINRISSEFGVTIVQPLLNDSFVSYAKNKIPISDKITGPDDLLRKHIIRKLAYHIGLPESSANKPKKAIQYGSQIHKTLLKSR